MDNKKKKFNTNRVAAYALSGVMLAGMIPYNVFANPDVAKKKIPATITSDHELEIGHENTPTAVRAGGADALSSATYYKKAN